LSANIFGMDEDSSKV